MYSSYLERYTCIANLINLDKKIKQLNIFNFCKLYLCVIVLIYIYPSHMLLKHTVLKTSRQIII